MTTLFQIIVLVLVSLVQGLLGTISGGGGGLFAVPAMVSTINESPSILVGSVFLMYLATSTTGLIVYSRKKLVDYRTGIILSIPTIPGVAIGTLLESTISNFEFRLGLGLVTGFFAVLMLSYGNRDVSDMKQTNHDFSPRPGLDLNNRPALSLEPKSKRRMVIDSTGRRFSYTPNFTIGLAINLAAGVLSGLFGAGAGIIIVPMTILLVKLPSHVALATTRIILMMLNISALVTHIGIGAINAYYAMILAIGAVIGAVIGARIAFRIHPDLLSKLIAAILFLLGAYLVLSLFV